MRSMELLRDGHLDDAATQLTDVLAAWPEQPDALHLLGVCRHEQGDTEAGQRLIREAIEHWPGDDAQVCVPWNNLGNVLVESGQPDAAIDAYRAALAAQPDAAGTWTNVASLLRRMGRLEEAEAAARAAVAAADDPHAWFTLARVLIERGDVPDGLQAHARGVALAPRDVVGREEVLRSLAVLGHRDEAAVLWGEWLAERPDDPVAQHHYAASVGRPPERASDAYVAHVFDEFATSFDSKLAKLHYRAPALIVEALDERLGEAATWGTVADLGCGTGLAGAVLRPHAARLVGADLSTGMLQQAGRRRIYDELAHMDLVSFLRTNEGAFDVVVAADVLCYFGALDGVIAAAETALRPGGTLAFTVELLADHDDWSLALTGRYAHSPRHVIAVMRRFDEVAVQPCELRMEAGRPVAGLVITGQRRSSNPRT